MTWRLTQLVNAAGVLMTAATETTLEAVRALFAPATALPGSSFPSTTRVGACLIAADENTGAPALAKSNSTGSLRTQTSFANYAAISRSAGALEAQRGISFSSALGSVDVFVDPAASSIGTVGGKDLVGYVLLVNKSSAAVNTDPVFGGHTYPVSAGEHLHISSLSSESFSAGLRAVLSTTPLAVTLGGPTGTFTIKGL